MVIDFFIQPAIKGFSDSNFFSDWNIPKRLHSSLLHEGNAQSSTLQNVEALIGELDGNNIDIGVIIDKQEPHNKDYTDSLGRMEKLAEFINAYPNRLRAIPIINISAPEAKKHIIMARQMGMTGVRVDPFWGTGGYPLNAPQFLDIYKTIEEKNLILVVPMCFMSGKSTSQNQPQAIEDIAISCPNLKIVVLYSCYPKLNEFMAMIARYPNRIYSLPSFYFYYPCINTVQDQTIMYNHMLQDQVLYGSSYPIISLSNALKESINRKWLQEPKEKFLYKNAAKLLQLPITNT